MKPFSNLIEKLFGGAVEEIGGMWQDALRVRRLKRLVNHFRRVQEILDEVPSQPHRVSERVWVAVLEGASLEDEDVLQQKWANLLANASLSRDGVPPAYAHILPQLSLMEVKILDAMYRDVAFTKLIQLWPPSVW